MSNQRIPLEKKQGSRKDAFRKTIQSHLYRSTTILGKIIDVFIIFLNLLICFIFVLETYQVSQQTRNLLWDIELITVFFFIVEYVIRLYVAPDRLRHIFRIYSVIDLVAILPTLSLLIMPFFGLKLDIRILRILRVVRVVRIFRFLRFTSNEHFFFGSISRHMLEVVRLILTILIIFFIFSGVFLYIESSINPNLSTFGDSFYFTVVALTTVGFGDITPVSDTGRAAIVIMILSGIILIPYHASQIVKEWFYISLKKEVICPQCGLRYHERDASHCKSCGHVIFQEYDGDL